jgi:hypothetical protein
MHRHGQREREREIYFKELGHAIGEVGKSKLCLIGLKAGKPRNG